MELSSRPSVSLQWEPSSKEVAVFALRQIDRLGSVESVALRTRVRLSPISIGDIGRLFDHLVRTQYDGRRDGDADYSQRRVAKLIAIIRKPSSLFSPPPRQAIASSERCQ